jgi:hypothetical protein
VVTLFSVYYPQEMSAVNFALSDEKGTARMVDFMGVGDGREHLFFRNYKPVPFKHAKFLKRMLRKDNHKDFQIILRFIGNEANIKTTLNKKSGPELLRTAMRPRRSSIVSLGCVE